MSSTSRSKINEGFLKEIHLLLLIFFSLIAFVNTEGLDCESADGCYNCYAKSSSLCTYVSGSTPSCQNKENGTAESLSIIDINKQCSGVPSDENANLAACGSNVIEELTEKIPQSSNMDGDGHYYYGQKNSVCRFDYNATKNLTDIVVRKKSSLFENGIRELIAQYNFKNETTLLNKTFTEDYEVFKLRDLNTIKFYYYTSSDQNLDLPFSIIINPNCFSCYDYDGQCGEGLDPYDPETPINEIYSMCIETTAAQEDVKKYCGEDTFATNNVTYQVTKHNDYFFKKNIICKYTYIVPTNLVKYINHPSKEIITSYDIKVNVMTSNVEVIVEVDEGGEFNRKDNQGTDVISGNSKKATEINVYIRSRNDITEDPQITMHFFTSDEEIKEEAAEEYNKRLDAQDAGIAASFFSRVGGFVTDMFSTNIKNMGVPTIVGIVVLIIVFIIICKCCCCKSKKTDEEKQKEVEMEFGKKKKKHKYVDDDIESDGKRMKITTGRGISMKSRKVKVARKRRQIYEEGTDPDFVF